MNTKARAFVLGIPLSGLGVTRSLGEAGIRVTGVDLTRWLPALFSRYCDTLTCPSPVTDPDALLERLLVAGGRLERPAVLFPNTDAFVLFASRYRAELERRFLLALPPPSVSEALADKWLQHQLVAGAGIACPRTFLAESAADLDRIKREIDYPAFLKPRVSHLWAPVFTSKGVRVDSQADLERRLSNLDTLGAQVGVIVLGSGNVARARARNRSYATLSEEEIQTHLVRRAYRWVYAEAQPRTRIVIMTQEQVLAWAAGLRMVVGTPPAGD